MVYRFNSTADYFLGNLIIYFNTTYFSAVQISHLQKEGKNNFF